MSKIEKDSKKKCRTYKDYKRFFKQQNAEFLSDEHIKIASSLKNLRDLITHNRGTIEERPNFTPDRNNNITIHYYTWKISIEENLHGDDQKTMQLFLNENHTQEKELQIGEQLKLKYSDVVNIGLTFKQIMLEINDKLLNKFT